MKIFSLKTAQTTTNPSATNAAMQEISAALNEINIAVATINKNLEVIQNTRILELFQKDSLINAIQSGNTAALQPETVDQAAAAMSVISKSILKIHLSMAVLKEHDTIARQINSNYETTMSNMIQAIQSGQYQGFEGYMANFQAGLAGISGTAT